MSLIHIFDDELKEIMTEVVRCGALDKVLLGLDFFDASINRVAAWVVGTRNAQKALLWALLQPHETLKALQDTARFTEKMVRMEAAKTLPFGDIWDCLLYTSFAPGYTYYPRDLHVQVYDVTPLLAAGGAVLRVYLGQGWYCGRFTCDNKTQIYGEAPAVAWVLKVTRADGAVARYCSDDAAVKAVKSPYAYAGLYAGEIYCADGGPDEPVQPVPYTGKLPEVLEESGIAVKVQEELPVRAVLPADGVTILDFGQNFAGIIEIDPTKMEGAALKLRHGEILNPDGSLYTANLRKAKAELVYRKGAETEKYRPRFTYMGFRYVELSGVPYREGLVTAYAVYSDICLLYTSRCV